MLQYGIVSWEFPNLFLLYLCIYIAYPVAYLLGGLPSLLKSRLTPWQTAIADILCTGAALLVGGVFLGFHYSAAIAINPSLYTVGLFAILGRIFPIYTRSKDGGNGLFCLAAVACILCPIVFVILLLFYGLILLATRYLSLSTVICSLLFPLLLNGMLLVLFAKPAYTQTTLVAILMGLLITYTHRQNLSAIMRGEEPKIKLSRKPKE